jgi:Rps23 Pro-64 3,4-dihydroxylase Tpa1-like proline 4-hydroxylase
LSEHVGVKLYADYGLHGGGWHIHDSAGILNQHLDYSLHPKLELQRKINIIIYVTKDWKESYGGHLGLFENPDKLVKEVSPLYNRAIVFDTTQNSWHGLSRVCNTSAGVYRKSLAIYYLTDPPIEVDSRNRALFAPREDQKNDPDILKLIESRSK